MQPSNNLFHITSPQNNNKQAQHSTAHLHAKFLNAVATFCFVSFFFTSSISFSFSVSSMTCVSDDKAKLSVINEGPEGYHRARNSKIVGRLTIQRLPRLEFSHHTTVKPLIRRKSSETMHNTKQHNTIEQHRYKSINRYQ